MDHQPFDQPSQSQQHQNLNINQMKATTPTRKFKQSQEAKKERIQQNQN